MAEKLPSIKEVLSRFAVATNKDVKPGDRALFQVPRHLLLEEVSSVERGMIYGGSCGISLAETVVFTQDGKIFLGEELVRRSLAVDVRSVK